MDATTANAIRDFLLLFLSIVWEALPFVVLGATIAGILEELSPRQAFAFMMAVSVFLLVTIFLPRGTLEQLGLLGSPPSEGSATDIPFLIWKESLAGLGALAVLLLLLRVHKPIDAVLAFLGRHRVPAIAMSGTLGLIMPMCECGIVPVVRRLLRKGMPLSCCTAYMLAGPIINIVVLLSTYMAFAGMEGAVDSSGKPAYQLGGLGMVGLRAGLGWLVAVGTGLVVERQYRLYGDSLLAPLARASLKQVEPADSATNGEAQAKPLFARLGNISETALHDFVDIAVFLILGALLASFARVLITNDAIEEFSRHRPVLAIGAMMGLAVLLCLCSEADAFVAASFVALRPAAKVAFLVLGPMLDLKLYLMYLRVFRPRLIWSIIPCVVVQVLLYSLLFHFVWETYVRQP